MQDGILRESRRKYDLLSGIKRTEWNEREEESIGEKPGKKLLEIARKKYELLHGMRNSAPSKPNSEEKIYVAEPI